MCKAHNKVTHIKQQKYVHHLKGRGYNKNSVLYPRRLRWWKYFCCFICVTLLWALHIVIKQVFFYIYNYIDCYSLYWQVCLNVCSVVFFLFFSLVALSMVASLFGVLPFCPSVVPALWRNKYCCCPVCWWVWRLKVWRKGGSFTILYRQAWRVDGD